MMSHGMLISEAPRSYSPQQLSNLIHQTQCASSVAYRNTICSIRTYQSVSHQIIHMLCFHGRDRNYNWHSGEVQTANTGCM